MTKLQTKISWLFFMAHSVVTVVCVYCLLGGNAGGYQFVTPAYYDQSGQLVMGNSRALPQMVRLMSPATLLMNSPAGQQSKAIVSFE